MTGRGPGNDGHGYEDEKGRHMDSKESKYEDASVRVIEGSPCSILICM